MEIKFPQKNSDEIINYNLNRQSLIIIGANGSGKSHLAAFIEKKDYEIASGKVKGSKCLRISAQRIMNFAKFIPLKSYEQAENKIIYGNENFTDKQSSKWYDGVLGGPAWTTSVINDYNEVLAATVAKINEEYKGYYEDSKNDKLEECKQRVNNLLSDKIKLMWNEVLPERKIEFQDARVIARCPNSDDTYDANQMSDGERVCLYMICQVMVAPKDMLIIVDEPELHLHPSIMNRLWTILERYRPDCHFIYVTHDTEFAAQHQDAKIIWVKSFDGNNKWDYEELNDDVLPDALLLKILGNRKNVLFVEGKENSWDYKIYNTLLSSFYVIPEASCHDVIRATKTYRENPALHHLRVFGLIDRDYRTDEEIDKLKKDNIYCLGVAEVENLFLDPDVLSYYHDLQGITQDSSEKLLMIIKDKVLDSLKMNLEKQEINAVEGSLKYHLSVLPLKVDKLDKERIKQILNEDINAAVDMFVENAITRFENLVSEKKYASILTNYNAKGLYGLLKDSAIVFANRYQKSEEITKKLYDGYRECIIRRLKMDNDSSLKAAFLKYIPNEILVLNHSVDSKL